MRKTLIALLAAATIGAAALPSSAQARWGWGWGGFGGPGYYVHAHGTQRVPTVQDCARPPFFHSRPAGRYAAGN